MDSLLNFISGIFGGNDQQLTSPVPPMDTLDEEWKRRYVNEQANRQTRADIPVENPVPRNFQYPEWMANAPAKQSKSQTAISNYSSPSPTPTIAQYAPPRENIQGFTTTPVPQNYSRLINDAAKQAGVHPAILSSILFSEHGFSDTPGFNYNKDGSYDRGPAQINSAAHPEVTDEQALDPNFAIPWAAQLLKRYIKQAGSLHKGIAAYNVGVGGANINGPEGELGPKGKIYLNKVLKGLSPELKKQLGLDKY